jgi:hypothetical protein
MMYEDELRRQEQAEHMEHQMEEAEEAEIAAREEEEEPAEELEYDHAEWRLGWRWNSSTSSAQMSV